MEGGWQWCSEKGGTRCPKGVFRNRGKMEENRYSLVAGKSRVERAKRGCREKGGEGYRNSTGWKREIRAHPYRGVRTHSRIYTCAHIQNHTTLRLGLGKTIPGKTPKIRRYETTWEIPSLLRPSRSPIPSSSKVRKYLFLRIDRSYEIFDEYDGIRQSKARLRFALILCLLHLFYFR